MSVDEWDFKVTKIKHPVIDYLKTSGSAELFIEGQLLKGGGFASDRWLPAFYNPFIEDLKETGRLVAKAGKDGSITESEIEEIVNRDSYKLLKAWKQDWLKDPKDYHVMAEKFRETNMLVINYVCEERKIERLSLNSLYHSLQYLNQRIGKTLLYQKLLLGIVAASLLMFAAAGIF
ncbi:hypothetical protein KY325_01610, partial [Candidatus Woesearchaeota archaeon]|nr:hypothetical protein [Candidatus Woesearchaeota archaeon]